MKSALTPVLAPLLTPLLTAALLSACAPADIVPQQTALQGASLGLGTKPAPTVAPDWWKAFHDPQLDRLMAMALHGNPTLEMALARMRGANAQTGVARAGLFPQVDLNGQAERQRFSKNYIIPPPYGGSWQWMSSVEANLSWNIDFWGKQAAAVSQAGAQAEAAARDSDAARLAISGAMVQAYVALARAYDLADIAGENETQQKTLYDLALRREQSGLAGAIEHKQAEALYSRAREDRIRADMTRDIAVHEIASLAGHGADLYGTITRPRLAPDAVLALPASLPADLLARRPDILAARARIEAAVSGRKIAEANFYPDINLLAFAGWQAIGLSSLFNSSSGTLGAGPAIHLPIFDAGKLRAEYGIATADLDEAVASYNGAVTGAVREAADALTRIDALDRQERQQHQTLSAAEDAYDLATTRYESGLTDQLTVIQAHTTLLQEQQSVAALRAERANARVGLLIAVGGGFDAPAQHTIASSATLSRKPVP